MATNLHEIAIAAPPARVFAALTDAAEIRQWWTDDARAEAVAGSVAEFGFFDRRVVFRMRIDALTAPATLRWACIGGPEQWVGTALAFDVAPAERGGTTLRFKHSGWRSRDGHFPTSNTTWGHLLHRLRAYAEGRSPGPYFRGGGVDGQGAPAGARSPT